MADLTAGVLLDTCAVIWLANGDRLPGQVTSAIIQAALLAGVFISPISAWEIGMLGNQRGNRAALRFFPDPKAWFAKVMTGPGIREAALTPGIAIDASRLPGSVHGDPADRLLISTARHLGVPIVTRDDRIIAYAEHGHVQVLPC